jgi:hypothetical protein
MIFSLCVCLQREAIKIIIFIDFSSNVVCVCVCVCDMYKII